MSQFIYGPVIDGLGFLYASINQEYYYLKPDPKPGFPPYFGKASPTKNQLTLETTVTETGYTLTSETGAGFVQVSGIANLSTSSKGSFNYLYLGSVTPETGLLYGVSFQMIVDNQTLIFKWKSAEDELKDQQASSTNYAPTYSGDVTYYFLVPLQAREPTNCDQLYDWGPFLAYSNNPEYQKIWYSTLEWCLDDRPTAPCLGGKVCSSCYGPCSDPGYECIPDPGAENLKCRVPGPVTKPWYEEIWIWILIAFAVFAILIVGLFLILQHRHPK